MHFSPAYKYKATFFQISFPSRLSVRNYVEDTKIFPARTSWCILQEQASGTWEIWARIGKRNPGVIQTCGREGEKRRFFRAIFHDLWRRYKSLLCSKHGDRRIRKFICEEYDIEKPLEPMYDRRPPNPSSPRHSERNTRSTKICHEPFDVVQKLSEKHCMWKCSLRNTATNPDITKHDL